ncbi:MAG: methyltransferase domain-containing protein [Candidatus Omnitrophota bacterium]
MKRKLLNLSKRYIIPFFLIIIVISVIGRLSKDGFSNKKSCNSCYFVRGNCINDESIFNYLVRQEKVNPVPGLGESIKIEALAIMSSSQNPAIKRKITAELIRKMLLFEEEFNLDEKDEKKACTLLRSEKYRVRKDLIDKDLDIMQAVTEEQFSLIVKTLKYENLSEYEKAEQVFFKNYPDLILDNDVPLEYFQIDLMMARVFTWLSLLDQNMIFETEIPEPERKIVKHISDALAKEHCTYFFKFFNIEKRFLEIQKILNKWQILFNLPNHQNNPEDFDMKQIIRELELGDINVKLRASARLAQQCPLSSEPLLVLLDICNNWESWIVKDRGQELIENVLLCITNMGSGAKSAVPILLEIHRNRKGLVEAVGFRSVTIKVIHFIGYQAREAIVQSLSCCSLDEDNYLIQGLLKQVERAGQWSMHAVIDEVIKTEKLKKQRKGDKASVFFSHVRKNPYVYLPLLEKIEAEIANLLPNGARVLDLMSGYNTYVPESARADEIVGIGLNNVELGLNSRLTDYYVQDLNQTTDINVEGERFDAAICASGIAYLENPLKLFVSAAKVLKPGGLLLIAFNFSFYNSEASKEWKNLSDVEKIDFVKNNIRKTTYFQDVSDKILAYIDENKAIIIDEMIVVTARRKKDKSSLISFSERNKENNRKELDIRVFHKYIKNGFVRIENLIRNCVINVCVSRLAGISQRYCDGTKLYCCVPVEIVKRSADSLMALKRLKGLRDKVSFELIVSGVTARDKEELSLLNRKDIRKILGFPENMTVTMIEENEIQLKMGLLLEQEAEKLKRIRAIKSICLSQTKAKKLSAGEYMAIVTEAEEQNQAEILQNLLKGELSSQISIRVLAQADSGKSILSFSDILSDWLESIMKGMHSTIKIILPRIMYPSEKLKQLNDAVNSFWKVLAAA